MAGKEGEITKKKRTNTSSLYFFLRIFNVLDLLSSGVDRHPTCRFHSINDVVVRFSFFHLLSLLGGSVSLLSASRLRTEACITGECLPATPTTLPGILARVKYIHIICYVSAGRYEQEYRDKVTNFWKAINKVNKWSQIQGHDGGGKKKREINK